MSSSFNTFYKTFSSSDTLVFITIPNSKPVLLGNLTTISYSTYRTKNPVSTLGRINISGFTRGQRVVAGTMIFTVINQHWINELIESITCLGQFDSLKPDELPLFDLMIVSANEYGASMSGTIHGVDVTDDSGVISVNDYFTETTISFLARDINLFRSNDTSSSSNNAPSTNSRYANSYEVEFNNSSSIDTKSYKLRLRDYSNDCSNGNKCDYCVVDNDISINPTNTDSDFVIKDLNNYGNIDIFTESKYNDGERKVYTNSIVSDKVTFTDIVSSFVASYKTNSYPTIINCIIKTKESSINFNIKVVMQ